MHPALSTEHLNRLDSFAADLAKAAAAAILPLFRADHGLEDKGGPGAFDPVTAADRGAEAAMRQAIAAAYPEHGVIGEEYGEDRPEAEFVWVLDPVDGTRAFIAGVPLWTTLIGLRFCGAPVVGVIAQPYLDELFIGTGEGSRLVRRGSATRLAVRPCTDLGQAIIATTDPDLFIGLERAAFEAVRTRARLARYSADAYAFAMVALGRIDLVIETGLKAWDIEAAVPILAGAGGLVTDWAGQPVGRQGGRILVAGDRRCLDDTLRRLAAV